MSLFRPIFHKFCQICGFLSSTSPSLISFLFSNLSRCLSFLVALVSWAEFFGFSLVLLGFSEQFLAVCSLSQELKKPKSRNVKRKEKQRVNSRRILPIRRVTLKSLHFSSQPNILNEALCFLRIFVILMASTSMEFCFTLNELGEFSFLFISESLCTDSRCFLEWH